MDRLKQLAASLDAWTLDHRWTRVARRAVSGFISHEALQYAGSMAYFSVLSLFQLLVLGVVVFSLFFGQGEARQFIVDQVSAGSPLTPDTIGGVIDAVIESRGGVTIVGGLFLLWSALGVFTSISNGIGRAFAATKPRGFVSEKLLGLLLMGMTGALAAASLAIGIVTGILQGAASGVIRTIPGAELAIGLIGLVVPFLLIFVAFLLIYRLVPNRHVTLREVWPGALVASLLWTVLRFGFTYYATNIANYDSAFGPISTAITLLVFLYFASVIVLLGAEVARASALEDEVIEGTLTADPRLLPVVVRQPFPALSAPRRRLPAWLLLVGGAVVGAVAGRLTAPRDEE
jgi:membrane protein